MHEWQTCYLLSKEWPWRAISSARDFDNIDFFKNKHVACEEVQMKLVSEYFKNKIEGYMRQIKVAPGDIGF